jgi:GTP cyclohydrolase II
LGQSPYDADHDAIRRPSERPRIGITDGLSADRLKIASDFAGLAADVSRPPTTRAGVTGLAEATLPTRFGEFRIAILRVDQTSAEVVVLTHGEIEAEQPVLVRLQSECLTGEVFGSLRCDCGEQLAAALEQIAIAGRGVLVYLRQEGRGIGLANKIRAYALQDRGLDTVEANLALGLPIDGRDYTSAAAALRYLSIRRVRLLTNNPTKCRALEQRDLEIVERIPLEVRPNRFNRSYLRAKADRLGHALSPGPMEPWDP